MPLYNGRLFLDQAVLSVLDQSYKNWELLIVDDGSKDESFGRALYWQNQDSRIFAFQHENRANRGVSATRNLAINNSKGEYLALLDCDDKWVPDKLRIQVNFMLKNPGIALTYAKAEVIDDNDELISDPEKLANTGRSPIFGNGGGKTLIAFEDVIFEIWVPASTAFFSKKVSMACGNFDETLPVQVEDILLFTQIAEKGKLHFMDEILLQYRIHSSQWNTKLDKKNKLRGKLLYLIHLSSKVNIKNNQLISSTIIWELFNEIVAYSISYNKFDFKFVFYSLFEIWKCNSINSRYTPKAFPIVINRLFQLLASGLKKRHVNTINN